jgi:hypothetical protein
MEVIGADRLDDFFSTLPRKWQRGVLRKAANAGAQVLVEFIRDELKRQIFAQSRGATRESRRAARESGKLPLARTITKRSWSVPLRGIIGAVVGPGWPAGAHGHLVEYGHRVVTHKGVDTGKRAKPLPFQKPAEEKSKHAILRAFELKLVAEVSRMHEKYR